MLSETKNCPSYTKAVFDDCRGWVDAKLKVIVSTESSDKGLAQCIEAGKTA
jgi:hypothetical protein